MATKSTQDFIPIKEVRDGIVILNNGSLKGIIMTSSVNFALKGADEQSAIIYQFQNFLNSLNFSIQIATESRRLDIRPYLAKLEIVLKDQTNDLLKIQTREYIEFIKGFTESVNIMTKTFFIVVPYTPPILQKNAISKINFFGPKKNKTVSDSESFEENRTQLIQRMEVVIQGLARMGVRGAPLGTEEIVELYYKLFNPGDTEKPLNINDFK